MGTNIATKTTVGKGAMVDGTGSLLLRVLSATTTPRGRGKVQDLRCANGLLVHRPGDGRGSAPKMGAIVWRLSAGETGDTFVGTKKSKATTFREGSLPLRR
jgi:hypothetical protein